MAMLGKGAPPNHHHHASSTVGLRQLVLELLSDTCSPPCRPSGSPNNLSRKGREKSFVNHSAHQQCHFLWDSTILHRGILP